jgi:hypothetical protein
MNSVTAQGTFMKELTLPINQLFSLISAYEKVNFIPEQEQFLNSSIQIKDENDNWVEVNAAITKETFGRKVSFDTGDVISAADKHLIHDGEECVYLDSLHPGDVIRKQDGTDAVVTKVIPIDDTLFYDLSVLSDTHLYQTANGFIHHNTELAKLLSKNLDMPLLKYDMSEYSEKHSVSSLIGPPPGYVGFSDSQVQGGRLISDLSKNPHSVMLFDEVEKAHPDIFNIFLQLLDEGRVTGSNGKVVSCKNSIIIMTSNLGSSDAERNNIGFGSMEKTGEDDKALKEFFKPEFRNRLDLVCKFKKLDMLSIKKIVIKFVDELKKLLLDKHNITLNLSEQAVEYLADKGYDNKMGARPLARKIDELLRVPLSKKILFERINNVNIIASVENDVIMFNITQKSIAHVGEDGVIYVDNA